MKWWSPEKLFLGHFAHISISFVFLQFTSFHSVLHSFHGLLNSINWPPGHCMDLHSSDGRALQRERRGHGFESRWSSEKLFLGHFAHISISFVFLQFTSFHSVLHSFHGLMNSINRPPGHCMDLHSSDGRALQRERRGHGFESRWSPEKLFSGYFAVA